MVTMGAPLYSSQNYLTALQSFLPRGKVWPRTIESTQATALSGLTPAFMRTNSDANNLLVDAFPATTLNLLPQWEATFGLPDPCAGIAPTVTARRAQVVARLSSKGGQSVNYMIAYAASLGYTITITQFTPARAGMLRAGYPVCGIAWAFAWQVNAPPDTVNPFLAGTSCAGEPLSTFGNTVLECELSKIAPAHTTVIFNF